MARAVDTLLALLKKRGADVSIKVKRCRNRLTPYGNAVNHPFPGTFPSVGGWRLPAHFYDADPETAEVQARIIAEALSKAGYEDEWYWQTMKVSGIIMEANPTDEDVGEK